MHKGVNVCDFLIVLLIKFPLVIDGAVSTKCQCGKTFEAGVGVRIVGGAPLSEKAHPFFVLISLPGAFCGGSIISKRYVLTAGHCLPRKYKPDEFTIVAGLHDRVVGCEPECSEVRTYSVEKILRHRLYNAGRNNNAPTNDIALLKTTKDIEFSHYIQPACLPFGLDVDRFRGALVMGWGVTAEDGRPSRAVRGSYLSLISDKDCSRVKWTEGWVLDYNSHFCAFSRTADTCQGDSGGPVFVKDDSDTFYQVGIVSFGEGCRRFGKPGLYTRIKSYLAWIKENVQDEFCTP